MPRESRQLRPLTDRILARLPGPDWVWVGAWAVVPWLNAGANVHFGTSGVIWEESRVLGVLNYAAVSFAVVIAIWGSGRLAGRLERLSSSHFRSINSVGVPLAGAVVTAVAFAGVAYARDGWGSAVLRGATWFVLGVVLWTFLWTYASLQIGLLRFGREHVLRQGSSVDPSLGLRPIGRVAFTGLWLLLICLVPVLWTGLPDVEGVVIGLVVLGGGLAAFFLSLYRLHRRMVEVKEGEIAIARELYAQAYEPVHTEPTLETLERQRSLLGAADALEKRAREIHEWPVEEGTFARVVAIATSVTAATIGRLILEPLGL